MEVSSQDEENSSLMMSHFENMKRINHESANEMIMCEKELSTKLSEYDALNHANLELRICNEQLQKELLDVAHQRKTFPGLQSEQEDLKHLIVTLKEQYSVDESKQLDKIKELDELFEKVKSDRQGQIDTSSVEAEQNFRLKLEEGRTNLCQLQQDYANMLKEIPEEQAQMSDKMLKLKEEFDQEMKQIRETNEGKLREFKEKVENQIKKWKSQLDRQQRKFDVDMTKQLADLKEEEAKLQHLEYEVKNMHNLPKKVVFNAKVQRFPESPFVNDEAPQNKLKQ